MKSILIALVVSIGSLGCASTKLGSEYDYYYFSRTAFLFTQSQIQSLSIGAKPNHTTVDGIEYTCLCPPEFIEKEYRKNFPDVVLVKKLPKGKGKIMIHY